MANIYWDGSPNYTSGNDGIAYFFPHWTVGGFAGSVATLKNPSRQASAHYVIEGNKAAQLVSENDTAWHCDNWFYNRRSLSYELVGWPGNPPSKATLDTCARLMAKASQNYFKGAKLVLGQNVMLHKMVSATSCPGETDITYLIAKANEILGKGTAASPTTPQPTPAPSKQLLDVDGSWGPATTRAVQKALCTYQDGIVSGQYYQDIGSSPGLHRSSWQLGTCGSDMVAALQRKTGANPDRYFGRKSILALQKYLGTTQDGVISMPSQAVMALQRRINQGKF